VSKANRRRQRPGYKPPTARPSGAPASTPPSSTGATLPPQAAIAGGTDGTAAANAADAAAEPITLGATPATPAKPAAGKTAGSSSTTSSSTRPSASASTRSGTSSRAGASRAGRRERQRTAYQPSFLERNRTPLVLVAAVVGVALLSAVVFFQASQPAFACSTIWTPQPTASPAPGATPNLGYPQPDMGHNHVTPGTKVTYTYCAPASGNHFNNPGTSGPIPARVYGPSDTVIPQGWIHNLEHGGLVILYKGDSPGATPEGQAAFKQYFDAFPPTANCGPVIARFDQMSSPFQAILWGRVLLLDTFDQAQITAYWNQWGGKTNLEPLCPTPNSSPNPSATEPPNASPSPSVAPSGS
jgi:hypothetical protein